MAMTHERGELEAQLTEARRMLTELRAGAGPRTAPEEREGSATALGGLVTAWVTGDGRVDRVEIDPRAKRLPMEDIAAAITQAVNEALDSAAPAPAERVDVDLVALSAQVGRAQDEGMRQLARFTSALDEAMDRLGKRP